jgi:hypothetical protein
LPGSLSPMPTSGARSQEWPATSQLERYLRVHWENQGLDGFIDVAEPPAHVPLGLTAGWQRSERRGALMRFMSETVAS